MRRVWSGRHGNARPLAAGGGRFPAFLLLGLLPEYDARHERKRNHDAPTAMALDCSDLVCDGAVRRDANRGSHASARDASRVDGVVRGAAPLVAAVGAGNAGILRLGKRYPLVQVRSFTAWMKHAFAWALISLISAAWSACLEVLLNPWTPTLAPGPFGELWLKKINNQLLSSLILYGCVLLVGYMLDSRERLARQQMEATRLSEQLTKAQLNALRHQIEPHFLFNTLNAIAGQVREGNNDGAVDMIARLSEFLRHLLRDPGRQEVPLGEELEFVQKYLDIQKVRFADRLQVKIDVVKELDGARVPSLILQPIVENAVKHGIAKRAQGGAIEISAMRVDGKLTLSVYNDGPSLPPDWDGKAVGHRALQCAREAAKPVWRRFRAKNDE